MSDPLKLGATPAGDGTTSFRVWAPRRERVEVALETARGQAFFPLERQPDGHHQGVVRAGAGDRYRFRLDGAEAFPDPASRFQPDGPHGASEIIDATSFRWTDSGWRGPALGVEGQVIYELHVGAFTEQGTYAGVASRLPRLKALGVTCVELMPLNTFPGRFNWGYDGVGLFAPCPVYGRPDELRALIDEAHRLGLSVILDAVYNHFGPDGNYLSQYSPSYVTDKYPAEWGEPIAFEGPEAAPVREFFLQNACHWISEYHFDGLRLDATQSLHDRSERHIVAELSQRTRAAAGGRRLLLIGENEPQDVKMITPLAEGGNGLDAIWIDDFHHCAKVAATGNAQAFLCDYAGTAQELLSCAVENSLYQGQHSRWLKKPRGTPLSRLPPSRMVFYLENHDQVSNSLSGSRLSQLTSPSKMRALTTWFLLLPQTPMLFMGQELFAPSPFRFFVDHQPELTAAVRKGRAAFLSQFEAIRSALEHEGVELEIGRAAFDASKIPWPATAALEDEHPAFQLHRSLLTLRREDPVLRSPSPLRGATLSAQALVLRHVGDGRSGERLIVLNLGGRLYLDPCPYPLLAPIPGRPWRGLLSSEELRFGGMGALYPAAGGAWELPSECAFVLTSEPGGEAP